MEKKPDLSIPEKLYYKIGEVSEITGVEPYVLRYWESEFKIINPARTNSKQRLYRKRDLELILEVKKLLYKEKFTIAGAKKRLQEIKGLREKQLKLSGSSGSKKSCRTFTGSSDRMRSAEFGMRDEKAPNPEWP
jgi:DNA-binding transcriptional MerR regulator